MVKTKILPFLGVILFFALLSCGGNPNEQFSSVMVYISIDPNYLQADTATWSDNDGDGFCDSYSVSPASVNMTVEVTPFPNIPENVSPSPVEIERVDIIYTPKDNVSPQLSTEYRTVPLTLQPNSQDTKPVVVLSESQLENFINSYNLLRTNPSLPIFNYYVTLRVHIREIYSNDRKTIEKQIDMAVSDFGPEECR